MNPCIKISFPQIKPWPYPWSILCMYSVYTPSVGVVGLAEYICTHPCLIFTEEDPDFIPEDIE